MGKCKKVAFYLPQFHEIPENNHAWGQGFTEWVNVRKAKPLFEGHYQPRVPLNHHYYNLLEPDTLQWQGQLAREYGVDAFCFYHYWFQGRMVLEKPVELLRNDTSIPVQYCFAWANEPWTKTWHGAGGSKEIMIPQTYGGQEEWERHFDYFLPYFQDERYLKPDNKPIVLIYRLQNIPRYNDMIRYWKERALREGFDGIHLVVMKVGRSHIYMSRCVDATVDFEPNNTKYMLQAQKDSDMGNTLDYVELNETMLKQPHNGNEYRTVFADYDDTPRRGSRGTITKGSTPQLFGSYAKRAMELSEQSGAPFLFLNAWNEWGEGNYLEPDERNGYGYLEALRGENNGE